MLSGVPRHFRIETETGHTGVTEVVGQSDINRPRHSADGELARSAHGPRNSQDPGEIVTREGRDRIWPRDLASMPVA